MVLKLHARGYTILDPMDAGDEHSPPVMHMFLKFGFTDEAKRLFEAIPEFGNLTDAYVLLPFSIARSQAVE
jgi:hypothetical protein